MGSDGRFELAPGSEYAWERLGGESSKAFEAFVAYREMGAGRSTAKVAQGLGKSKALIDRWCSAWRWVERVQIYEAAVDRAGVAELLRQRKEMIERHAKYGRWMQGKAAELIVGLQGGNLTVEQARRFMELGIKVER